MVFCVEVFTCFTVLFMTDVCFLVSTHINCLITCFAFIVCVTRDFACITLLHMHLETSVIFKIPVTFIAQLPFFVFLRMQTMTIDTWIIAHMSLFGVIPFLTLYTKVTPVKKPRHLRYNVKTFVVIVEVNGYTALYTVVNNSIKMVLGQYMYLVLGKNSSKSFDFFDATFLLRYTCFLMQLLC